MAVSTQFTNVFQGFGNNYELLAGGKVYITSTSTGLPITTWSDVAKTVANTNPVILSATGKAVIILDSGATNIKLTDSAGTVIWTFNNYDVSVSTVTEPVLIDFFTAIQQAVLTSELNASASSAQTTLDVATTNANVIAVQSIADNLSAAPLWISNTPYAQYVIVTDPVDLGSYKSKNVITSTNSPSTDTTNWKNLSSALSAVSIPYNNSTSGLTSTNIQALGDELSSKKQNKFNYKTIKANVVAVANDFLKVFVKSVSQVDTINSFIAADNTAYTITVDTVAYTYTSATPVAQVDTVTINAYISGNVYAVKVDGIVYSYTAKATDTVALVADGVANLIPNGVSDGISKVTITSAVVGVAQSVSVDISSTVVTDLTAITTVANISSDTISTIITNLILAITATQVTAVDVGGTSITITANTAGTAFTATINANMAISTTTVNKVAGIAVTMPTGVEDDEIYFSDVEDSSDVNNIVVTPAIGEKIGVGVADEVFNINVKGVTMGLKFMNGRWGII